MINKGRSHDTILSAGVVKMNGKPDMSPYKDITYFALKLQDFIQNLYDFKRGLMPKRTRQRDE